ncbi:MAG: HAMP domain-containing protein [Chloroflexi bacterium]|nr:MAG: HAMP domain-containing protein [Chloroflexota bacterium]MBL1196131.1 HAMP domain-containing protein [Chloroflexota bacterium]NOH13424.1 HAMP domain-containing protein [Chloroflexota bacterium]
MNRMWVRISLALVAIIVFGLILPLTWQIATSTFDPEFGDEPFFFERGYREEGHLPEEFHFEDYELPERGVRALPGFFVLRQILQPLGIFLLVTVLAAVLLSRSLTSPLNRLVSAAKAIGAKDLSQRVDEKGTSEVRQLARAFNEMAEGLEHAETLRSNLLADVAHELRTPLSVVQGNLRAILDDVYELDKAEIARIYEQTRHLTHLVDDLRVLAQAEAQQLPLELAEMDVSALLQDTVEAFAPIAEENKLNLELEMEDDLPNIQADRSRITQSLHNLLHNAMHHTSAGGTVTLRASQQDTTLTIKVEDTGAGMDTEQLARVFDRFYRADEARSRDDGGTGLGLAIVKAIIEAHGGEVSASSEGLGQGSLFRLVLPIT